MAAEEPSENTVRSLDDGGDMPLDYAETAKRMWDAEIIDGREENKATQRQSK